VKLHPDWAYCEYYNGCASHERCAAGVRYDDLREVVRGRSAQTLPCCLQWGGRDSCSKRVIGGER